MEKVVDGNTAAAMVAYKLSQVIPIYPITPSSPMAEFCDGQVASGKTNIFGQIPKLLELQSEAGVAGTLHGSLCAGAMTTTFTSSQGLLLMIPNLHKLAGEHLPCVIHVAARAVASHALSIFGDHSDVMAIRQSGVVLLCSNSVQEAHDFALLAHVLSYKTSLPVVHFFDGFRTSHEMQKIEIISDEVLQKMLPLAEIEKFKNSRLCSEKPYQKGTAQNPDVFFQNREASSGAYKQVGKIFEEICAQFCALTGREYHAFELVEPPACTPKNVVVVMGSAGETLEEVVQSDKNFSHCAVMKVHLYRPFEYELFEKALPKSVEVVNVLDRTKECGAREPLFLDVKCALSERKNIKILGGRYGLGGKDFTPTQAAAVLKNTSKDNFTVGIVDDVNFSSLQIENYQSKTKNFQMKFWGLGSDGTVSASKSTIKILGEQLGSYVQGYFEYDSKKSGSLTRSHVRVSENKIKSAYLVDSADVVTISNFSFVHRYNCLEGLKNGGKVLINSVFNASEVDRVLPDEYKQILQQKNAKLFVINAQKLAESLGLGNKINIIMQTALFKISRLIDFEQAQKEIEKYVRSTFAKKGKKVVDKNLAAAAKTSEFVEEVDVKKLKIKSEKAESEKTEDSKNGACFAKASLQNQTSSQEKPLKNSSSQNENSSLQNISPQKRDAAEFHDSIMTKIEKLQGDTLPVSAFDECGKVPLGTAEFEKRGIAAHLPKWLPKNCIQCGQCALACPHNAIRPVLVKGQTPEELEFAAAFGMNGYYYRLQVSPEDCTGCGVCADVCPAKNKALVMHMASEILDEEKKNYAATCALKSEKNTPFSTDTAKGLQFEDSYFAFSGACGGCGETPYIRLATTLFGKNMIIANATGCSSIYGGSFPSCPYLADDCGNGPAWANSLFEDNAEFGLGIKVGTEFLDKNTFATTQDDASAQDATKTSVWIIGGDGWAYDIGYGGLDHVLNSGENVNILVLDSEVYSNTGGQASKSTPRGAMVKFANSGKATKKKDLVAIAIAQKNCYVAQVSLGANSAQCIKAFKEAESFNGPSLIVAYSPCVNHGINMSESSTEMRRAVESGYWTLLRFHPQNGLTIDSTADFEKYESFLDGETRFAAIKELRGQSGEQLLQQNKQDAKSRLDFLKKLAEN